MWLIPRPQNSLEHDMIYKRIDNLMHKLIDKELREVIYKKVYESEELEMELNKFK